MARGDTTRFLGHPLTPQPQPLDAHGRAEAGRRLETADTLSANPDVLDALVETNRHLREIAQRTKPAHNRILWSGLANLDTTGVWSNRAGGGLASGAIWVYSPTVPLIVATGGRQSAPPNWGPGVFYVPANEELTLNAHAREWTLYGQATTGPSVTFGTPASSVTTTAGVTVVGAVPAAGANPAPFTATVEMTLEAVTLALTTNSVAGNRFIELTIRDPSGNLIGQPYAAAVPASISESVTFAPGNPLTPYTAGAGLYLAPLPALTLQPGSTITVSTVNLGTGDQLSAMTVSGTVATTTNTAASATTIAGAPISPVGALVDVTVYADAQGNENR